MTTASRIEAPVARSRSTAAAVILIMGLCVGLSVAHAARYRTLSPVDEWTHIDYLFKVADGSILRRGDVLGQAAMNEFACRGIDIEFGPLRCHPGEPYRPREFYHLWHSQGDHNPPTYYAITALLGRTVMALTGESSLVDAGRIVSGLWLGIGLFVLWLLLGRFDVSWGARAVILLLVGTTPAIVHASVTVNTDATALLVGGLALLAAVAWEGGDRRWWLLALVGAFAAATKITALLGVAAAVLYLAGRAVAARSRAHEARRLMLGAAVLSAGAVVATLTWAVAHEALERVEVSPLIAFHQVDSLQLDQVLDQTLALVTPVLGAHLPPFLDTSPTNLGIWLFDLLLLGAVVGGLLFLRAGDPPRSLAAGTLIVLLLGGIAFTVLNYVSEGIFFGIPQRYGLSVVPALAVLLGVAFRNRVALWAGSGLAALTTGVLLFGLSRG